MAKNSKKIVTLVIVTISVSAILGFKYYRSKNPDVEVKEVNVRVKGDDNAPIKIKEFLDMQCPACARGAMYLNKLMSQNPGKVQLELNHFPLKFHKHAMLAATYVECAGRQDAFWPFHDRVIREQGRWRRLEDARPVFNLFVQQLELNADTLEQCLEDAQVAQHIQDNKAEGTSLGVKSTPSYFVNGKMVVGTKELNKELTALLEG